MSLFDKFFAPDPQTPQQQPVVTATSVQIEGIKKAISDGVVTDRQAKLAELARKHIDRSEAKIIIEPSRLLPEESKPIVLAETETFIPVPVVAEEVKEIIAPVIEKTKAEYKGNVDRFSGREFVEHFLGEVNFLIDAGKQLQVAIEEQANGKASVADQLNVIQPIENGSKALLESISGALTNTEESGFSGRIQKVYDAYRNFLETLDNESKGLSDDHRKKSNDLILQITKRRGQVDKLLVELGGKERFEAIKAGIRSMEKIGKEFAARELSGQELGKVVTDILDAKSSFVMNDLAGAKMLVQSGGILDVLIRVANERKN